MSTAENAVAGAGKVALNAGKKCSHYGGIFCGCIARQIKKLSVRSVTVLLRVLNILNAIGLGAACFFGYNPGATDSLSITEFFLSTYLGIFAIVLMLFETRFKKTEVLIRRFFGFMFNPLGRAGFLVFLGGICFAFFKSVEGGTRSPVCLGVGIGTVLNAALNCFVICSHPGFRAANQNPDAGNVTDPSKLSDEQIRAYLEAHPELAAQAIGNTEYDHPQQFGGNAAPAWGATAASPTFKSFTGSTKGASAEYVPPAAPASRSGGAPPGAVDDNPFASAANPFN